MNWMLTRKTSSPSYFLLISNRVKFPHLLGRGAGVGLRGGATRTKADTTAGAERETRSPPPHAMYTALQGTAVTSCRAGHYTRVVCVS